MNNRICFSLIKIEKILDTYTLEVSVCWSSWKLAPFDPYSSHMKHSSKFTQAHLLTVRQKEEYQTNFCAEILTNFMLIRLMAFFFFLFQSFNFTTDSMTENPPFSSSSTCTNRKKNRTKPLEMYTFCLPFVFGFFSRSICPQKNKLRSL